MPCIAAQVIWAIVALAAAHVVPASQKEVTHPKTRITFHVENLKDGGNGSFTIDVHPVWAPLGAARFAQLVEQQFYNDAFVFRAIPGFVAQFGISSDPVTAKTWKGRNIVDDSVRMKNLQGRVSFASAGPDSRNTQVFVNLKDNTWLDKQGFAPFGEVVEGLDVVRKIYSGYGEGAPLAHGPEQRLIEMQGGAYLKKHFPKLSKISSTRISVATDARPLPPFELGDAPPRQPSLSMSIVAFVALGTFASGVLYGRMGFVEGIKGASMDNFYIFGK